MIEAAARVFDPDVLTVGFARRNATYKRLGLLVQDPARAIGLLSGPQPIQLVLAGKAHPSDEEAKRVVQDLYRMKDVPHAAERAVYLHEYDLAVGKLLVRGCSIVRTLAVCCCLGLASFLRWYSVITEPITPAGHARRSARSHSRSRHAAHDRSATYARSSAAVSERRCALRLTP